MDIILCRCKYPEVDTFQTCAIRFRRGVVTLARFVLDTNVFGNVNCKCLRAFRSYAAQIDAFTKLSIILVDRVIVVLFDTHCLNA